MLSNIVGSEFPATKILLIVNLVIYLAMAMASANTELGVGVALRWGALRPPTAGEPWRYLSAVFVHFNLMHIGFNSLGLYQLGRSAERHLGWARFVLVLIVTGALGFVVDQVWTTMTTPSIAYWLVPRSTTAGMSGGLFGLLGLAVGWKWAAKDPAWKRIGATAVAYVVVMAFLMSGVNHVAHGGGLVTGGLMGAALYRWGRSRRLNLAFAIVASLLLASAGFGVAFGSRF